MTVKKMPLTDRQKEVLDFIGNYIAEQGYAPTLREVAFEFSITIGSAQSIVNQLVLKRHLRRRPGKERGLEVA